MNGTKNRSAVDKDSTGFWGSVAPLVFVLGGAIAAFALATKRRGEREPIPRLVVLEPGAQLVQVDRDGENGVALGLIVSCPQTCAVLRPGGTHRYDQSDGQPIYPTHEWMREITFVPFADDGSADTAGAQGFLAVNDSNRLRIKNDNKAVGCGYVSMNVTVTQLTNPDGTWQEDIYYPSQIDGTEYFYAIANGVEPQPNDGYFHANEVWISEDVWEVGASRIAALYNKFPPAAGTSPCP